MKILWLPILTAILFTIPQAHAKDLTFRYGEDGYKGVSDTTLVGHTERHETLNYGHSPNLEVAGTPQGGLKKIGIIRFADLTGPDRLPEGTTIQKAVLRLFKTGEPQDSGQYGKYQDNQLIIVAHPLVKPWTAGTGNATTEPEGATYAARGHKPDGTPEFWGGKDQPESGPVKDVDYDTSYTFTAPMLPGETDTWVEWDITPLAQEWINHPENNYGLLLGARGFYIGAYFASSEAEDEKRPQLVISW